MCHTHTVSDLAKTSLVARNEHNVVPTARHTVRVNCADT
ncbi:hypothetical protein PAMC26577_14070 [Caballeronia sordidicola]|uniref:Uncharacterized protein n=1 Tax=Caballeronia sordidicola TaxID=196367 RepID=A0A242MUW3_CABSO|nr:hypothetical protein PAMC26577_14070 [Caballeronia sordidicola]